MAHEGVGCRTYQEHGGDLFVLHQLCCLEALPLDSPSHYGDSGQRNWNRMAHKATTLAKWFISRVERDSGDDITHLKLQKLLYYAQAWHLAHTNAPLFNKEIKAWTHGPVVTTVA